MRTYPPGDPRNKGKAWDDMARHEAYLRRKEMEKRKKEMERLKSLGAFKFKKSRGANSASMYKGK